MLHCCREQDTAAEPVARQQAASVSDKQQAQSCDLPTHVRNVLWEGTFSGVAVTGTGHSMSNCESGMVFGGFALCGRKEKLSLLQQMNATYDSVSNALITSDTN
jgi:hypothetical protein